MFCPNFIRFLINKSNKIIVIVIYYTNLPSGNNGLGSARGKLSDSIAWTFSLSTVEALFNAVFTLKSIIKTAINIMKYNQNVIAPTCTYQDIPSVSSFSNKPFQYSCASLTIFKANSVFLGSPLNANLFSGLPSGIL